eukprot:TRINITY_DN12956_c0_g1_i1.p1 TRINITY_DN12956_c0_g1~~TRINITY_DN12956_c0_g1_i1.p1  ORF type:complete len:576 (+),score=97.33 TRINITY_DN12956_c0_g1_i1:226-1728(+)
MITGKKVAVKTFYKRDNFVMPVETRVWDDFCSELKIALRVDSPYIVKVLDVYESRTKIHMVMSLMRGGSLVDVLLARKVCREPDVRRWAKQLCLALNYLHGIDMVHRDLKPANVMFDGPVLGEGDLALIDFGLSKFRSKDEKLSRCCGTFGYKAPEVLQRDYTSQADMWSLGVLLFRCIVGHLPFEGSKVEVESAIKEGNYVIRHKQRWERLPEASKEFLQLLLVVEPQKRLSAAEALAHPWIADSDAEDASPHVDWRIADALANYTQSSHFKRACMLLMVWSSAAEEHVMSQVKDAFEWMDRSKDGKIVLDEFVAAMNSDGSMMSKEECVKMFRILDSTGDGWLEYSELVAAMVSSQISVNSDLLDACFLTLDVDQSDFIELEDLREVFGESFGGVPITEMLEQADIDGDGKISYEEYTACLCGAHRNDGRLPSMRIGAHLPAGGCCVRFGKRRLPPANMKQNDADRARAGSEAGLASRYEVSASALRRMQEHVSSSRQ